MTREEIQQYVFDTLGVILVDKSEIREDSTLDELVLDRDDIESLFRHLELRHQITIPDSAIERAEDHPDSMTVKSLVDLILFWHEE